jgi:hypothetical protein
MKPLLLIFLFTLPLLAQPEPPPPPPPPLTELPTELDVDDEPNLDTRLSDLSGHCPAHQGIILGTGPTYRIPSCTADPKGQACAVPGWPCCLANRRRFVLHSDYKIQDPPVYNPDGTLASGGDRILALRENLNTKLEGMCIPYVRDRRLRAVINRLLDIPRGEPNPRVRFIRRPRKSWTLLEESP